MTLHEENSDDLSNENIEWIIRALLYFGFSYTLFLQRLIVNGFVITSKSLHQLYIAEIHRHYGYSSEDLILAPKYGYISDIKNF